MPTILVILVGFAGFAGSLAVSNLLTWHRDEPDRTARYFGLVCLGFAAYSALQAYVMTSLDLAATATLLRWQGAALAFTFVSLVRFGATIGRRRVDWLDWGFMGVYLLLGGWSLVSPSGYWFANVTGLEPMGSAGSSLYLPRGDFAPTYFVSIVAQYPLFLRQILDGRRAVRSGSRIDGWLWIVCNASLIATGTHDHLVDFGMLAPPYLGEYSFPLAVLTMGTRYAQRRSREFARLRQLQDSLAHSEAKLRELYESSSDAIFIHDATTGAIIDVNRTMCEMYGYTREESLALSVTDLSATGDEDTSQRARELLEEALLRDGVTFSWRARRKDQSTFPVEVTLKRTELNGNTCVVANVRDQTEREAAVGEKRKLEERLWRAQRLEAIGHLAGGVAHDFNNLLTPIMGHVELILDAMTPSDPARYDLEEVLSAAKRAQRLTQQLLRVGRRGGVESKTVDLCAIVVGMKGIFERLLRENIMLDLRLDPAGAKVSADPAHLEQVLMNLVVNARDAMPEGGKLTLSVVQRTLDSDACATLDGCSPGVYAMLSVSDDGIGMSEEVKRRLFEPFFTTKAVGRGTGLGLATVLGIVQQHGGALSVDSAEGAGTTLNVYLPIVEAPILAELPRPSAAPSTPGTETVILVEDDASVRAIAQRALERHGYKVRVADSAESALELVGELTSPPRLLLTDVVLPKMNGRALYEQLRRRLPALRVLYMSGYSDETISQHGLPENGVALIPKPFTVEQLLTTVRGVLE